MLTPSQYQLSSSSSEYQVPVAICRWIAVAAGEIYTLNNRRNSCTAKGDNHESRSCNPTTLTTHHVCNCCTSCFNIANTHFLLLGYCLLANNLNIYVCLPTLEYQYLEPTSEYQWLTTNIWVPTIWIELLAADSWLKILAEDFKLKTFGWELLAEDFS